MPTCATRAKTPPNTMSAKPPNVPMALNALLNEAPPADDPVSVPAVIVAASPRILEAEFTTSVWPAASSGPVRVSRLPAPSVVRIV